MLDKEKVDRAKWYLADYSSITLRSDLQEAATTVLRYIKELEDKVIELKMDNTTKLIQHLDNVNVKDFILEAVTNMYRGDECYDPYTPEYLAV